VLVEVSKVQIAFLDYAYRLRISISSDSVLSFTGGGVGSLAGGGGGGVGERARSTPAIANLSTLRDIGQESI
jgi:hypothetical protein